MLYTYLKPESEDTIYEQTILNEMHISKNDLKNPEVLKKVLEQSKKEKNLYSSFTMCVFLLGLLSDVVLGIVTGSILLSIGMFIPILVGSAMLAYELMIKCPNFEDKNINKLVSKTEKLKKNAERLKDEKAKSEIIATCDKILNSVAKYRKSESHKKAMKQLEADKKFIKRLIDTANGEDVLFIDGYPEEVYKAYLVADKLGIAKPNDLDKAMKKYCTSHPDDDDGYDNLIELSIGYKNAKEAIEDDAYLKKHIEEMDKAIPGYKDNAKMFIFYAIDDTVVFYNFKNGKFYWGDYDPSITSNSSLYEIVKKYANNTTVSKEELERYKGVYDSLTANK